VSAGDLTGAFAVGKNGNIKVWQPEFATFADLGVLEDVAVRSLAFDSTGTMWAVDTSGNALKWIDATATESAGWKNLNQLGHWALRMLTFSGTSMYAVNTNSDIGQWDQYSWSVYPTKKPSHGTVGMITFDHATPPALWAVCDGEVQQWGSTYNQWEDLGQLGDKTLTMLTFDTAGLLWGVGTDGSVSYWSPAAGSEPPKWSSTPGLGTGPNDITWLAFRPSPAPPSS
jgi:hypothetical protein